MSRSALVPVLVALAAAALAAWVLLGVSTSPPEDLPAGPEIRAPGAGEPSGPVRVPGGLQGDPSAPRSQLPPTPTRPERVEEVPRGVLLVKAVGPDETPFLPDETRIFLEPVSRSFFWAPTGLPDPKTGVWRFEKIPAGKVRARVHGDHVVEAAIEAEVVADQEREAVIHADRGGAVAYRVVLYSGDKPSEVTLSLLDADRNPVRGFWQVRSRDVLTTPRADTKVTQGPEGAVYGILPGTYRLRAQSPAEEFDEVDVEVKPGETTEVEIRLRE